MKRRRILRSYTLALYPNAGKAETVRYTLWWAQRFCRDYVDRLYDAPERAYESTAGLSHLANDQQKRAWDMLRTGRATAKATGRPFHRPKQVPEIVDARIRESRTPGFQFWVKVPRGPWIPAQTHRALSRAIALGGKLRIGCELRRGRHGGYVVRAFVEYPKRWLVKGRDYIGADVGVSVAVATSDGRRSQSLRPLLTRTQKKRAEQSRQGHRCVTTRSTMKQYLDHEARRLVTLAQRSGKSLVIERLKTLGKLKPSRSIGGWARTHFGERVLQIAEIAGVAVHEVHPAYTSLVHWRCGYRGYRRGVEFTCDQCESREHADINAARNLVRKATGAFQWGRARAGIQIRPDNILLESSA